MGSRKIDRKFSVYNSLQAALRRAGFQKTGALATLLLETFIENGGLLWAQGVENAELCKKDSFKEWREPLIKAGWLEYDYAYAKAVGKGRLHQPGKKLMPYLNKEKMKNHSLVTETQLNKSLAPINSRLDVLSQFIRGIIEEGDPPYTQEKEKEYIANPRAFLSVALSRAQSHLDDEEDNSNVRERVITN